ncbi:S-adenosylmethionine-dependent methyltransferase [Aspergillus saccharolyticus JOP 1030-1]|uniref:Methyltransferase n=1 Tax=Aspergillus saccharolyticus JOP 1030-1 TaxID=1450539 RepID=A0A318ZRE7_9EURO|nr:methyltransferase [Aspergillus saccharolyticus JOP 1030-1]PYH46530.1 methyltransferase [Aspergillus saccharolyticus JOP 1030-1]
MLPTPCTAHVSFDTIYEPAEDSYLFLDTLSSASESAWLTQHFASGPSPTILEVGSGSGVVLAFVVANSPTILGRADVLSLSTDLNRAACLATRETVVRAIAQQQEQQQQQQQADPESQPNPHTSSSAQNTTSIKSQHLSSLQTNLATPLRPGSIDLLLFNPPYVPTDTLPRAPAPEDFPEPSSTESRSAQFERASYLLSLTYAGGKDGMEITEHLLADLPRVLSARGVAYVLLCAQNRPREVVERIRGWGTGTGTGERWCAEIAGFSGKQAGWEKLVIVRVWRE